MTQCQYTVTHSHIAIARQQKHREVGTSMRQLPVVILFFIFVKFQIVWYDQPSHRMHAWISHDLST